jgi:hypothetical protein
MRAKEFIVENRIKVSTTNLIGILDTLRNRFGDLGQEPRIRVDSLVNMVREIPGSEMFNVDTLKDLYDNDPAIKNMISSIKKDDSANRYIYLNPAIGQASDIETDLDSVNSDKQTDGVDTGPGPEATVSKMSKRALGRRS